MTDTTVLPVKPKRDSRVELLRLYACLAVLVLHFKPSTIVNGTALLPRLFVTCLCTDAVGVFLLIAGFFFFQGRKSYGKRMAACLQKILIPTLVYTLLVATVYPLAIGSPVDYRNVAAEFAATLLTWNPIIHNAQHLWYMYLYVLLVAAYPLLRWVKEHWLATPARQTALLVGSFAFLLLNDLTNNRILHASMAPVTVLIPGVLFVLAGSILYQLRHAVQGRPMVTVISLGIFVAANALRSVYMCRALNIDPNNNHLYGWCTGVGFVCCAALAVAVLSFKPFASRAVNALASNTMEIYMLHPLMSEILSALGVRIWIVSTFLDGSERFTQYLKFVAIYPLLVFFVCSVLAVAYKAVLSLCKKIRNP